MKTNSKQVRELIRAHVLGCVTDNNENTYPTFKEAAKRLLEEFDRVANHKHNLHRLPNDQERFSDYLCGLPFSFEYTHEGIKDYLNGLGINPTGKEYTNDANMKLYHYLIWSEINKK